MEKEARKAARRNAEDFNSGYKAAKKFGTSAWKFAPANIERAKHFMAGVKKHTEDQEAPNA